MATVKNDKTTTVKAEPAKEAVKEVKPAETAAVPAPKTEEKKAAPKAEEKKPAAPKKTAAADKKPAEKAAAKKPAAKTSSKKTSTSTKKPAAKAATYETVVAAAKKKFASAKTAKIKYPIAANFELAADKIFYVYIGEAGVAVEPYKYDDYDIYFRTDAETLTKVLEGKVSIIDALADGSAKIDGNTKKAVLFIDAAF